MRLRGKFDSVDLISGSIYLQENKTKGNIDKLQIERQLHFDLQTMLYIIALLHNLEDHNEWDNYPFKGVRYNVVRRPLSGGVGNIKPHAAKYTKNSTIPAETDEEFYERLRRDYIADDPSYWFFRVRSEISARDIQVFCDTCLDPLLETLCRWYDEITDVVRKNIMDSYYHTHYVECNGQAPMNYRTPFGVWSALEEGGATEYDAYLDNGSEAGLGRVETLFEELRK